MIILPRYVASGATSEPDPIATIAFTNEGSAAGSLVVPMRQLGREGRVEAWSGAELVKAAQSGGLHSVSTSDFLLGWISGASDVSLERSSRDVYHQILAHIAAAGFPSLLRMWNHVGSINAPENGVERYQRFCIGRYEAFEESGYTMGADLPAASAIGKRIAEKAKAAGIDKVAFDRSGFAYHGRVKALAEAAREAGLQF